MIDSTSHSVIDIPSPLGFTIAALRRLCQRLMRFGVGWLERAVEECEPPTVSAPSDARQVALRKAL